MDNSGVIRRKRIAILATVLIAGLLTLWGIYVYHQYGIALFILTPFLLGAGPGLLVGHKYPITKKEAKIMGFYALGIYVLGLIAFAIEGLICIAMAAPFGLLFTWLGSLAAFATISKAHRKGPMTMLLIICAVPTTAFISKDSRQHLTAAVTAIDIDASPEMVWKNVIVFPQLKQPHEFIFKTGIAYPVNATIEGKGVGAIRYCNFTTGSFIEPITRWEENKLLQFNVLQQPAPMKELSFWDIDAPHLHDFFVSRKGQFKLIALPGGKTRLEGTTWYHHNIQPEFYWQVWSNYIVHKIHNRVLEHIKTNSEKRS